MSSKFNAAIDLINWEMAKFLPFRDMEVCKQVAKIKKEDFCKHQRLLSSLFPLNFYVWGLDRV